MRYALHIWFEQNNCCNTQFVPTNTVSINSFAAVYATNMLAGASIFTLQVLDTCSSAHKLYLTVGSDRWEVHVLVSISAVEQVQ